MIGVGGTVLSKSERTWLQHPAAGGVILFSRNFSDRSQVCDLVESIRSLRTPELLIAVDHEGGRVQRFRESFTRIPPMRDIGLLWLEDPDRAKRAAEAAGWLIGAELRACGIDLSFAPVVDLDLGIASVIGDRAFHRESEIVCALAKAHVRGMRKAGMAATAKHFPTHAGAVADSHLALAVDHRDYSQLYDDLQPYRSLIAAGLPSVMVGHVIFPELDRLPASISNWWIDTQLRAEFGFSGAVISDDLGMGGVAEYGSIADRLEKSLEAGCDLALICNDLEEIPAALERVRDYSDPAAQLRLIRLRGETCMSWEDLCNSDRRREALRLIDDLNRPPALELEG